MRWGGSSSTPHSLIPRSATSSASISPRATSAIETGSPSAIRTRAVVVLCTRWIRRFARNPVSFSVQYHADQDLDELKEFWGRQVRLAPERIRLQRKSNSNQLGGRTWRSRYGVLTIHAGDTALRARLQAWIDCLQELWVDSAASGRSSAW